MPKSLDFKDVLDLIRRRLEDYEGETLCDFFNERLAEDGERLEYLEDSQFVLKNSNETEVQAAYENGVCPDCQEPIADNITEGDDCPNCGHVFWLARQTDDSQQEPNLLDPALPLDLNKLPSILTPEDEAELNCFNMAAFDLARKEAQATGTKIPTWLFSSAETRAEYRRKAVQWMNDNKAGFGPDSPEVFTEESAMEFSQRAAGHLKPLLDNWRKAEAMAKQLVKHGNPAAMFC